MAASRKWSSTTAAPRSCASFATRSDRDGVLGAVSSSRPSRHRRSRAFRRGGRRQIFVQPLDQVIRIRTGERDNAALRGTADAGQRRAKGARLWSPSGWQRCSSCRSPRCRRGRSQRQRRPISSPCVPRAESGAARESTAFRRRSPRRLPKWFDDLAVNAFVSTAYILRKRPATGATSYRVSTSRQLLQSRRGRDGRADSAVQADDSGFRIDLAVGNSIHRSEGTGPDRAQSTSSSVRAYIAPSARAFASMSKVRHAHGVRADRGYDGYTTTTAGQSSSAMPFHSPPPGEESYSFSTNVPRW